MAANLSESWRNAAPVSTLSVVDVGVAPGFGRAPVIVNEPPQQPDAYMSFSVVQCAPLANACFQHACSSSATAAPSLNACDMPGHDNCAFSASILGTIASNALPEAEEDDDAAKCEQRLKMMIRSAVLDAVKNSQAQQHKASSSRLPHAFGLQHPTGPSQGEILNSLPPYQLASASNFPPVATPTFEPSRYFAQPLANAGGSPMATSDSITASGSIMTPGIVATANAAPPSLLRATALDCVPNAAALNAVRFQSAPIHAPDYLNFPPNVPHYLNRTQQQLPQQQQQQQQQQRAQQPPQQINPSLFFSYPHS